jgi:hypothetical protein
MQIALGLCMPNCSRDEVPKSTSHLWMCSYVLEDSWHAADQAKAGGLQQAVIQSSFEWLGSNPARG